MLDLQFFCAGLCRSLFSFRMFQYTIYMIIYMQLQKIMLFFYQLYFCPEKNDPFICVNKEANDSEVQKGSPPLANIQIKQNCQRESKQCSATQKGDIRYNLCTSRKARPHTFRTVQSYTCLTTVRPALKIRLPFTLPSSHLYSFN